MEPGELTATEVREGKELEKQKETYVFALQEKALAITELEDQSELAATLKELKKWVDIEDPKYASLNFHWAQRNGFSGHALRALLKSRNALAGGQGEVDLFNLHLTTLQNLGASWQHWANYHAMWKPLRFPKAFPPF